MIKKLIHIGILLFLSVTFLNASTSRIQEIEGLNYFKNPVVKSIRKDIYASVYVVKSKRHENEMPDLKFFIYRVKKDDSFFTILSKLSLDIDTLMTVNDLTSPQDIYPGMKLFIPNMRGVLVKGNNRKRIQKILNINRVDLRFVYRVNKCNDLNRDYIFIPCGKTSNLHRSLFLGTGFMSPLTKGRRSSGFGNRRNPFNRKKIQFHSGIDIACPMRSKVYASRGGRVVFTGVMGNYGKLIILQHEHGYRTYYGHLSKWIVRRGQDVRRGQLIGYSGNSGRTTGPHLHFEVRRKNRPINPGALIRKG
jgi:murein DD-endopeptidase MepM/ murein hydrolase activator NlpD